MEKWLQWAIEIQSLAQTGLTYTKDVFDKERYARLREISAAMLAEKTEISKEKVKDLFWNETGYPTPKIDTRAAIFKDNKILLVHEKNGTWSLPGGWCDVLESVKSNTEKEVKEETGLIVEASGNCLVSQAPFDYLHGKYNDLGIVWIDAHPDVSTASDGYPNAHAMVLGSLMGYGENALSTLMKNKKFKANEILYVGLQEIHIENFENIVVHFDVDVLDEKLFHSTYFANPDLVGDGSGGGKMTLDTLGSILQCITENANIVGFTIAEYLPFDEYKLHKLFSEISMFSE